MAAASYLTRDEARKRFKPYSGDAYQEAEYRVDKDSQEVGGADARESAQVLGDLAQAVTPCAVGGERV